MKWLCCLWLTCLCSMASGLTETGVDIAHFLVWDSSSVLRAFTLWVISPVVQLPSSNWQFSCKHLPKDYSRTYLLWMCKRIGHKGKTVTIFECLSCVYHLNMRRFVEIVTWWGQDYCSSVIWSEKVKPTLYFLLTQLIIPTSSGAMRPT